MIRRPRIAHTLSAPVLPTDNEPTHPTGAPTWIWTPGEVPPDVTPAPFRDAWAGNADTDRAWSA